MLATTLLSRSRRHHGPMSCRAATPPPSRRGCWRTGCARRRASLDRGVRGLGLVAEGDALTGKRQLDFLARLVDAPLDRRQGDFERVRDLRVRETDDVAEQQGHLQLDVEV